MAAASRDAVDTWLADPRSTPHGGESLLDFITRVGGWLDTRPVEDAGGWSRSPSPVSSAPPWSMR